MAKLAAHGIEIGRVTYLTSVKAYFEDGKVLKNQGFGWKLAGKLKDGITPLQAFENAKRKQSEDISNRPHFAAYKRELHSMAGIGKRWKLHQCISMMPEDADGVWSECCDGYGDNIHADIDEVSELCNLYLAAQQESAERKAETVAA